MVNYFVKDNDLHTTSYKDVGLRNAINKINGIDDAFLYNNYTICITIGVCFDRELVLQLVKKETAKYFLSNKPIKKDIL